MQKIGEMMQQKDMVSTGIGYPENLARFAMLCLPRDGAIANVPSQRAFVRKKCCPLHREDKQIEDLLGHTLGQTESTWLIAFIPIDQTGPAWSSFDQIFDFQ